MPSAVYIDVAANDHAHFHLFSCLADRLRMGRTGHQQARQQPCNKDQFAHHDRDPPAPCTAADHAATAWRPKASGLDQSRRKRAMETPGWALAGASSAATST